MLKHKQHSKCQSHPKSFKLIIFDCDGVLLDSEEIGGRTEVEALKELGISISLKDYNKRFAGVLSEISLKTVASEHGISVTDYWIESIEQKSVEVLKKNVKVIPDVPEVLQNISIPKAVASNSRYNRLTQLLRDRELDQYFDGHIFSAEMVKRPKPYPDLYLHVAEQMNVHPSECLVIEDSPTGAQAAHKAGMKVFGFIGACQGQDGDQSLFKAGADIVFNSMSQLPKLIEIESLHFS
jgi:HAD superfamily hydrolase (TIGR01509 family)